METKIFGDKKIVVREFQASDLKIVPKFLDFVNSFIDEDAKIGINEKLTSKQEKDFLESVARGYKDKTNVYVVAEYQNEIIAATKITLGKYRQSHVAQFGITVRQGYRGIGLGNHIMEKAISLAKKKIKPKIIRLSVLENNKPAISLYKKVGFKIVGKIPKQRQYKGKLLSEIIMILEV